MTTRGDNLAFEAIAKCVTLESVNAAMVARLSGTDGHQLHPSDDRRYLVTLLQARTVMLLQQHSVPSPRVVFSRP